MPGTSCSYETDINLSIGEMPDIFGFFYCEIHTNNSYLGLLPVREKQGIIMPNGQWSGWYFSEELKFAYNNGYKITIIKGYHFNKLENVFDDFVKNFYDIKSTTSDGVEKAISKNILNNLLGRFGLNMYKPCTKLVDKETLNELLQSKIIRNNIQIHNKYLVTYDNKVSNLICKEHNVDYKNTLINNLKWGQETEHTFSDVSIAIASAVTSYARILISKTTLEMLNKGCSIYYSDTDSLVTDTPLNKELVGEGIGQFKLEHTIKKAYFISSKTYCLVLSHGSIIIKAKGVNNNKLNESDFIDLYKGLNVEAQRTESYKNYSEGYVNLNIIKDIVLNGDAYTKRLKLFDNNIWKDTIVFNIYININTSGYDMNLNKLN